MKRVKKKRTYAPPTSSRGPRRFNHSFLSTGTKEGKNAPSSILQHSRVLPLVYQQANNSTIWLSITQNDPKRMKKAFCKEQATSQWSRRFLMSPNGWWESDCCRKGREMLVMIMYVGVFLVHL
jgi:hypothetical protein